MRAIVLLWAAIAVAFPAWHVLATNDVVFSRDHHDLVFLVYAHLLGIEPDAVMPLLMRAVAVDGLMILGVFAFRRRKPLAAAARVWLARRAGQESNASSRSSAP